MLTCPSDQCQHFDFLKLPVSSHQPKNSDFDYILEIGGKNAYSTGMSLHNICNIASRSWIFPTRLLLVHRSVFVLRRVVIILLVLLSLLSLSTVSFWSLHWWLHLWIGLLQFSFGSLYPNLAVHNQSFHIVAISSEYVSIIFRVSRVRELTISWSRCGSLISARTDCFVLIVGQESLSIFLQRHISAALIFFMSCPWLGTIQQHRK